MYTSTSLRLSKLPKIRNKGILLKQSRLSLHEKGTFVIGHENLGYENLKKNCLGVVV